jgi:hypothetical protein
MDDAARLHGTPTVMTIISLPMGETSTWTCPEDGIPRLLSRRSGQGTPVRRGIRDRQRVSPAPVIASAPPQVISVSDPSLTE